MVTLSEIQRQADELSPEDREGLLSYLIQRLDGGPQGIDDAEVLRREEEMNSGQVEALSQDDFLQQVGRRLP